jgi:SsrA-binding protein
MGAPAEKTVCVNRKARHEYEILETFEAGLSLVGTEVKSLRQGRASLVDAYAIVEDGQVFLRQANINIYPLGTYANHDPLRERKCLLTAREIKRLTGKVAERGLTLIPLRIYFKGPWAKVELALARGKRLHDKREAVKRREADREMERAIKERTR